MSSCIAWLTSAHAGPDNSHNRYILFFSHSMPSCQTTTGLQASYQSLLDDKIKWKACPQAVEMLLNIEMLSQEVWHWLQIQHDRFELEYYSTGILPRIWVNLALIATKANSTDFVSLLCPQWQVKVLRNPYRGTLWKSLKLKLMVLCFYGFYSDTSARMLFISKLNMPLQSSHKDESFGTKVITLGQCVNEL